MLSRTSLQVQSFVRKCNETNNTPSLFVFQHKINVFPRKNTNMYYKPEFHKLHKKFNMQFLTEDAYLSSMAHKHAFGSGDNYNNYFDNEFKYFTMIYQILSINNPSLRALVDKFYLGAQIELQADKLPTVYGFYKEHGLDKPATFFDDYMLQTFDSYLCNNLGTVGRFEMAMKKHLTFGKI